MDRSAIREISYLWRGMRGLPSFGGKQAMVTGQYVIFGRFWCFFEAFEDSGEELVLEVLERRDWRQVGNFIFLI